MAGNGRLKKKAGASSRTPNEVIYMGKYIRERGKVKENLRETLVWVTDRGEVLARWAV
jgi:hypothetical protein